MAWGTWLAPSQNVQFPNQQLKTFYVALGNLFLAIIVMFFIGYSQLSWNIFWLPFFGGLIWAVSGYFAFTGTSRIGIARAFGTWAPLNIIVGIIWGMVLWNEFLRSGTANLIFAVVSVIVIIIGVLLIIFSGEKDTEQQKINKRDLTIGFAGALGAGILWGTYFIPSSILARNTELSAWAAAFPLAVGMLTGSIILTFFAGNKWKLENQSDYIKALGSGFLWSIGNFTMLLLVASIGAGKGFTIAQLSVVVNALIGIYLLKEPQPKSKAAKLTLYGVLLATIGGIILGNLK